MREAVKQIRLYRQHLTDKTDKLTVVHDLNGIQAQFMVNAFHALKIRCDEKLTEENFGKDLVKNWSVRGTVHVFAKDDLPLFKFGKKRYRNTDWKGYCDYNKQEWWMTPVRQRYWADFIVKCVADGICEREALKENCIKNGMTSKEHDTMFDQWGGGIRELCENGFLNYKVQEKKAFEICPFFEPLEEEYAELEMARRYFEHYAPATIKDTAYYFHWTQTKVKEIMKKLPIEKITVDGRDYFFLDRLAGDYPDIPDCIFLAGFDQLMLGYKKEESIFLPGEHLRGIFNLAGIVMPAILLHGRVVGRWRKKNKKMTLTMFETVAEKEKKLITNSIEAEFGEIGNVEWI